MTGCSLASPVVLSAKQIIIETLIPKARSEIQIQQTQLDTCITEIIHFEWGNSII